MVLLLELLIITLTILGMQFLFDRFVILINYLGKGETGTISLINKLKEYLTQNDNTELIYWALNI